MVGNYRSPVVASSCLCLTPCIDSDLITTVQAVMQDAFDTKIVSGGSPNIQFYWYLTYIFHLRIYDLNNKLDYYSEHKKHSF